MLEKFQTNSSIRKKLILSFLIINLITILFGGFTIYQMKQLQNSNHEISEVLFPSLVEISILNENIAELRITEYNHIAYTDEEQMKNEIIKVKDIKAKVEDNFKRIELFPLSVNEKEILEKLKLKWKNYLVEDEKIISLSKENQNKEAQDFMKSVANVKYLELKELLENLKNLKSNQADKFTESGSIAFASTISVIILANLIIMAYLVYLSYSTIQSIMTPLNTALEVSEKLKNGDFRVQIDIKKKDEFGKMLLGLGEMIEKLSSSVKKIRIFSTNIQNISAELSSVAKNLNSSSQDMAASSEESSAAIEQMSSSLENVVNKIGNQVDNLSEIDSNIKLMNESILEIKSSADKLSKISQESLEKAAKGEIIVNETTSAMDRIKESSSKITEIVGLISDISSQTNLLALNAAIEAARAGDAGRGFAVVADSITKLADRTVSGVKQIQSLISATEKSISEGYTKVSDVAIILKSIIGSVSNIDNSVKGVLTSVNSQVSNAKIISDNSSKVNLLSKEISISSKEQKSGVMEINQSIVNVSSLAQLVSNESNTIKNLSAEFLNQSEELKNSVSFFKLDEKIK